MYRKIETVLVLFAVAVLDFANTQNNQCFTLERKAGKCINVLQCPPFMAILNSPNRQPSVDQYLRDSQCGVDKDSRPKVCCPLNSLGNGDGYANLLPSECGKDLSFRIHGGNATGIDEFPWMALLEYSTSNGIETACGGFLISKRYVLTAAHCLPKVWDQVKLVSVRLGEYNTATERDCIPDGNFGEMQCVEDPPLSVRIEEQIAHGNHSERNHYRHDIALLRLSRDVTFTKYIKPICLPSSPSLNKNLDVAGWGVTEFSRKSNVKLKTTLPVVDMRECSAIYQRLGNIVGEGQICAGGKEGVDSCQGDSGGPLMQLDATSWSAVGIVSFGSPDKCGLKGVPGVYTKVFDYIPWIKNNMRV